jgi:dephospho-CoA kinase
MVKVVGLTGGIASGKSVVADVFVRLGVAHVDTDQIARALTAANGAALPAVIRHFGDAVIGDNGLDRAAMRQRVFHDHSARALLESILHPLIGDEVRRQILLATGRYLILSVPLLFESGRMLAHCARTLVVDVAANVQLARLLQRDGITVELAERMLAAQASRLQRLARADDVLVNAGSLADIENSVALLHRQYLRAWR